MADPADDVVRLAMWSGPRNISTALMRSWENRPDSLVADEPLYAHYLALTGVDHPGRDEVIAAGDTDWRAVVGRLIGPVEPGVRVFYQKQMAHHLTDDMDDLSWLGALHNVLLIRQPAEVVASYIKSRATVTPDDLGLRQQVSMYDAIAASGPPPRVIDSADFLRDPRRYLIALCDEHGLPFEETMLSWPAGPRDTDGVWGKYWYDAVWKSTGFEPYGARDVDLSGAAADVAAECREPYQRLYEVRWLP
ncbi:MAG TPA: HAD family hydrolase [Nocardioidaceae bacterium]|nr:HAD family hydrolase [Nocardioidaceae bacterium]